MEFLTSLLCAGGVAVMALACICMFGGLAGAITGLIAYAVFWVGDLLACASNPKWNERSNNEMHDNVFTGLMWICGILWGIYALVFFVQSNDTMMLDMKHTITFGASKPGRPEPLPIVVTKTEIRRYKLIAMNPPKHFYVSIQDVVTGDGYNQLYVSKHCNNYATNQIGSEYNIKVNTLQQGAVTTIQFENLTNVFCQ